MSNLNNLVFAQDNFFVVQYFSQKYLIKAEIINNELCFVVEKVSEFEGEDAEFCGAKETLEEAFEHVITLITVAQQKHTRDEIADKVYSELDVEESTLQIRTYNLSEKSIEFKAKTDNDSKEKSLLIEASFIVDEYPQFSGTKSCASICEATHFFCCKEEGYEEFENRDEYEYV